MRSFDYANHTELVFGRGAISGIGEHAAAATDGRCALLVHSGRSAWERPWLEQARDSLSESGFQVVELTGVVPNPRLSLVRQGVGLAREAGASIVIGVGGGSAIDTAKAVAAGAAYEGDVWDLFSGEAEVEGCLPIGAVATIAASGAESSKYSVITNDDTLEKLGAGAPCLRPLFAIMDPESTFTLPAYQTACGAADIMAHAMDTYFGDTREAFLQHELLEGIMRTVVRYAPVALAEPEDYEARAQLMLAGTFAMGQQLGVGHSTNLAPHEIGEFLGGVYDVTHGAVLAVLEPACIREVMREKGGVGRVARFAANVMDVPCDPEDTHRMAEEGLARLRAFLCELGLPQTLRELGIDYAADRDRLYGKVGTWDADGDVYQRYDAETVDRILSSVAG